MPRMRSSRTSIARQGSGRKTLSRISLAAQQLQAAGRRGVLPPPQDISRGMFWRDRNRTQPYTEANKEQTVEFVDDLTGNPVGWQLGPNVWNDASITATGESQVLGGGRFRIYSSTGVVSTVGTPTGTITPKNAYIVSFYVESVTVAGAGITFMDAGTSTTLTLGWKCLYLPANSANTNTVAFLKRAGGATDAIISNVTVREILRDESWMGPNLVTNGDFSNGTTGWSSGSSFTSTGAVVSGELQVTATVAFGRQVQSFTTVPGRVYAATVTYRRISGTSYAYFAVGLSNEGDGIISSPNTTTTPATNTIFFAATGVLTRISCACNASGDIGAFDNITVREIPGHPIVSAVAGSGLALSRRVNLLQRTEDLTHSAWITTGVSSRAAGGSVTLSSGRAVQLTRVTEDSGSTAHRVIQNFTGISGAGVVASVVLRGGGTRNWLYLRLEDSSSNFVWINASTGALGTVTAGITGVSVTGLSGGAWLVTCRKVSSSTSLQMILGHGTADNTPTYAGDGSSWFEAGAPDIRYSLWDQFPGIPSYQRVNDGTAGVLDYDDSPAFPLHWRNVTGTQAMMTLGTVDMSAGDAGAIIAALIKTSDAAAGVVGELTSAPNTTAGSLALLAPTTAAPSFGFYSRGSIQAGAGSTAAAPALLALVGQGDISDDTCRLFSSGVQVSSSSADQGTGTLSNARFYIAARAADSAPAFRFTGILLHLPVLVAADAGVDLQGLASEYAASAGYIY